MVHSRTQKTGGGFAAGPNGLLQRPLSDFFNVAASRPAKSPRVHARI
jgi:hypothetical protein